MSLTFNVKGKPTVVKPEAVVIAGFTGRNRAEALAHIQELAELGVPAPASVPSFYEVLASDAVQTSRVQVLGSQTSGEAEAVLVISEGSPLITLGSDHTDRATETLDIGLAKSACVKPLAVEAWPLEEVAGHLEELVLKSWIAEGEGEVLYQEGNLSELLPPSELLESAPIVAHPDCFLLFTGTVPAIGGIRPSSRFRASLGDPILGRFISLEYEVEVQRTLG